MAKSTDTKAIQEKQWRLATRLVRGGTRRSEHGETSEAIFMTSGYVYGDAGEAESLCRFDEGLQTLRCNLAIMQAADSQVWVEV